MRITEFNHLVARKEGGKVNLPIAQIAEVTRQIREQLRKRAGVDIYAVIKKIK